MEHPIKPATEDYPENSPRKDRSLLYMGLILGVIIAVMGYLTFFVDDLNNLFKSTKEPISLVEDKTDVLNENSGMSDTEVRTSLIKFIEAFYFDQSRGYFDPPSYFADITQTYYNFHNLTFQRLRDVYNKRRNEMQNLDQNWIVSSLNFNRDSSNLVATYWLKVNYFKPAWNKQESADVKQEMIINEDGKILSLRELEIKNFSSVTVIPELDTMGGQDTNWNTTETNADNQNQPSAEANSEAIYEGKLYDLGSVETAPEFPGGQNALAKYVGSNLKYPASARDKNVQGKVYIGFIIEKNGLLSDLKIIKGIGSGCDEEALRVLKNSIAWKPGVISGKAVRTAYTQPITFQLAN